MLLVCWAFSNPVEVLHLPISSPSLACPPFSLGQTSLEQKIFYNHGISQQLLRSGGTLPPIVNWRGGCNEHELGLTRGSRGRS